MAKSIAHYLDASVLVQLVTKEPGSHVIEGYIQERWAAHFHVTEFAFYETLSVLKRKWDRKQIDNHHYTTAFFVLHAYLSQHMLRIDSEFKPYEPRVMLELREFLMKYGIDFSDALQIYTVLNGFWKSSIPEWEPVFVTADAKLEEVARLEGLRTWHFPHGEPPKDDE